MLFLQTIKKLPPQPASFYKPLETVTVTVTPHCTQKDNADFFLRLLGVENSVVCVAARPCRCSLRRRVLARAGRRLQVAVHLQHHRETPGHHVLQPRLVEVRMMSVKACPRTGRAWATN